MRYCQTAFLLTLVNLTGFAQIPEVAGQPSQAFALRKIDIVNGAGDPALPGQKYTVDYTGWLTNGKKFDSSLDRKQPLEFVQGRRQVISGWDSGFEGMRVGGKRRLLIPYQLAYGEKGNGSIPPKAELIFDVELLAVKEVPDAAPAADILLTFDDAAEKILALAKVVPADKYTWKPASGVRTFGQVFLHIAYGNQLLLNIANNAPDKAALGKQVEDNSAGESKPHSKEEIISLLTETFASGRKSVEKERAGGLGRDAMFFDTATTRRGILISLDAHMSEHLGQAIAYARMNGIVPPWSK